MRQTGINMGTVKRKNRASILNYINETGPISRKDIAEELRLTPAAVTQICAEFMERGILVEKGTLEGENRAGRKKILVDINYDHKYVFGINIQYDKTTIVLANLKGDAVKVREISTDREAEPEQFLHRIADICKEIQAEYGIEKEKIAGVGAVTVGIVDKEAGKSIHAFHIWSEEVPVAKLLSLFLDLPVVFENNVKAFAMAELLYGIGKSNDNMLFIKWGPALGSAIVIDKKVYGGRNDKAAEIGHFVVEKNGEICSCGRRGCLDTVISMEAIKSRLEANFSYENSPKLYEYLHGDFRNFDWDNFSETMDYFDESIQAVMNDILGLFARTIINSMTLLAPNCVVLCGTLFRHERIRKAVGEACTYYDPAYDEKRIVYTSLAESEDYIGAVAMFVAEYLYGF